MKSKLILWMITAIAVYFLFSHPLVATNSVSNDNVTIITVTQWCSTSEAVDKIINDFQRPTKETLFDYGCHWVPAFMPVEGIIKEIVKEYFIFDTVWHMVKVKLIGGNFENPIGYTLIRER